MFDYKCRVRINVIKHEHMTTNQVAASRESMVNPLPVRALVPRLKFIKRSVRRLDHWLWEQIIKLAGVEE